MVTDHFLTEVLNHRYINLYHELIVSAQQAYIIRNGAWTDKQISAFSIQQAQSTIKMLGYVNPSDN